MCHQDRCVCVRVRVSILYDFRLHESDSSVFKRITLTHCQAEGQH